MVNGDARLSIDLSSSAIAATVSRQGTRVPILIDGRLVMPPGVAIGPAGDLYVGVDATAARSLPADHRFVNHPADHLASPSQAPDPARPGPVDVLAAVMRHVGNHAAHQVGQPITDLTVTIPPAWGPRRRAHVSDAAARAGLPPPALVTAPAALAAYTTTLGPTTPENACVLVCQADHHPPTLTVLQTVSDGYRELATQQLHGSHNLDDLIARHVVATVTAGHDPLRANVDHTDTIAAEEHGALLESIRTARHQLGQQERAPVMLPTPHQPVVINRDDITTAAQPFLDQVPDAVGHLLDAADVGTEHLAAVIVRPAPGVPALTDRLTAATRVTPTVVD
ncbi:Hsp70 family protein, partial [Micromonospora sp. KC207]|uniref:Hsp70 family protein n=1 Tax=Micromonospora sp. KC207 TaxID=2530377 RepID=UPI0014053CCF